MTNNKEKYKRSGYWRYGQSDVMGDDLKFVWWNLCNSRKLLCNVPVYFKAAGLPEQGAVRIIDNLQAYIENNYLNQKG